MIDAFDPQNIDGFPDVLRRTFFPRVGHKVESLVAGAIEDPFELGRRMAHFR